MTAAQLGNELGLKESYIKSKWNIIKKRYEGYGIILERTGRGSTVDYGIKNYGDQEVRFAANESSV